MPVEVLGEAAHARVSPRNGAWRKEGKRFAPDAAPGSQTETLFERLKQTEESGAGVADWLAGTDDSNLVLMLEQLPGPGCDGYDEHVAPAVLPLIELRHKVDKLFGYPGSSAHLYVNGRLPKAPRTPPSRACMQACACIQTA